MDPQTDKLRQPFWNEPEDEQSSEVKAIKPEGTGQGTQEQMATTIRLEVPTELAILPIRNGVAFPGTVMPLTIGREKSKRLLDDILPEIKVVGIFAQKDAQVEDPTFDDLYSVGCACVILKLLKVPEGNLSIVVHGLTRVAIKKPLTTEPYHRAQVVVLEDKVEDSNDLEALTLSVRETAGKIINLSVNVPDEAALVLDNISEPGALADFLAANVTAKLTDKQELLETIDAKKRLSRLTKLMGQQVEVLELSNQIQTEVRESIDKNQREYFLHEQLKAIQKELGQADQRTTEVAELEEKITQAEMPEDVEKEARRELERMSKIPVQSPEYSVSRTYVDWLCEIPWSTATVDNLDIRRAGRHLDNDHYDLEKVKKRILEFLAVRKLKPDGRSPILCFVGPPGVGKTSLGKSIAAALGRKFIRISLGGIRDEADIRGHRRTYIGALPGRIIQEIRKAGSHNPVFMLDEVDKIGQDFRGDPASALLEVLDPEQNYSFTDHYLDVPFDLSEVMFIATANYMEPVPPALKDRMEVIELPGYTELEKLHIAERFLLPRQLDEHGLNNGLLKMSKKALMGIIQSYTREAGVRNLEREIAGVCRAVAVKIAKGRKKPEKITEESLAHYLGPIKYEPELALRTSVPGVATALAYTPTGGEIMFVEATHMPGKGQIIITGQLGDVMQESVKAAHSLLRSQGKKLGIKDDTLVKDDIHVHVPAGAVPKDGPSAGLAIYIALVSLMTDKPVNPHIAVTGEISLRGLILPV
ncbi:MAG: endopeptidase La, partial [Actinobacteria bacterium]|nr:endopeptidase La [Actinomycetota bacterium]